MGFLQDFFRNVFDEADVAVTTSSNLKTVSKGELQAHLQVAQYDDFVLSDAVRPSLDLKVRPRQGYRHDAYHDEESRSDIPVIMASASREILFPLFMDLIQELGDSVDVVLETSHESERIGHVDLYREQIDLPVLTSTLWEYEDLLVNDGCTGIAVLNPSIPQEIQFDEHKLLIIYGSPLEPFERLLEQHNVFCNEQINFITEAEHVHSSSEQYKQQFDMLRTDLGMDGTE
jgi:hypothetical protein